MDFKSDSFMYGLGICIVLFVIAQSVFFLVRAVRRAKALGIETSTVKKTISSSAVFTVAPALAIVATVITLAKALGIAQYSMRYRPPRQPLRHSEFQAEFHRR